MSRILNATTMRNILGVVLAISAWQVFAIISDTPLIPGLERIVAELLYMLRDGTIAHHALSSLATGGAGLCLALVVAAVLGVGAGRNWVVDAAIHPLVTLLYPVPKLALYPLIILLLGIGWPSRSAQVALECFFPLFVHSYAGAKAVSQRAEWLARNVGAGPWRFFSDILVPSALPTMLTGLRVAVPIMLIVTTVTEFIGDSQGLGHLISRSAAYFDTASSLAVVFVLGVIGMICDRIIVALRHRIVFWERAASL